MPQPRPQPLDPQPTPAAPAPLRGDPPAEQRRLAEEHQLDQAALDATPSEAGLEPTARLDVAPPRGGLRRRTRVLLTLIAGGAVFLAGVQFEKLVRRGEPPVAGTAPTPPIAAPPTIIRAEVVAIDGSTLYVREPGGRPLTLHATPLSRVARGQPLRLRFIRPGETILADSRATADGRLVARSITVVPSPSGARR
jgi:hypothetical protein